MLHISEVLFRTIFAGHTIVGSWVSCIVTVKEQFAVLPEASVTTNVLVVIPTGNASPEGIPEVCCVTASGQLSEPIGAIYVTIVLHISAVLFSTIFDRHAIVGSWVSFTVTVWLHWAEFPASSITVQYTVVVPTG